MAEPRWGLKDWVDWYGYRALRHLPIDWVSSSGALAARAFAAVTSRQNPPWWGDMLRTIAAITGEHDQRRLRQLRLRAIENIGRIRFEFSCCERLVDSNRLTVTGTDHLANRRGPTIFVAAHLGNWELTNHAMLRNGVSCAYLYEPVALASHQRIAVETRRDIMARVPGSRLIAASPTAARDLVRAVDRGENVWIAVDELKNGLVWGPAFGRHLPDTGNRMLAARLSMRGGGDVIPIRTRRTGAGTHEVAFHPPLPRQPTGNHRHDARLLGDAIAATFEPWVRADVDQWFWLPYLALGEPFPGGADR
jgi:KDO2-lipid IV(A) lauroyltransferase